MEIRICLLASLVVFINLLVPETLAFAQYPSMGTSQTRCSTGNCPTAITPRLSNSLSPNTSTSELHSNYTSKKTTTASSNPSSSIEETELIEFTNRQRTAFGLTSLKPNPELMRLARGQAMLLATKNQLSHSVDGQTFSVRIGKSKYEFMAAGENIAEGQLSAKEAVNDWMHSPGHRQNILNHQFTEMGVAMQKGTMGRNFYVQIFAKPSQSDY